MSKKKKNVGNPLDTLRPLARAVADAASRTRAAVAALAQSLAESFPPVGKGSGRRMPEQAVDTLASDAGVSPVRIRGWLAYGDRILAAVKAGQPIPAERPTTTTGRAPKRSRKAAKVPTTAPAAPAAPAPAAPAPAAPADRAALAAAVVRMAAADRSGTLEWLRSLVSSIEAAPVGKARRK